MLKIGDTIQVFPNKKLDYYVTLLIYFLNH
jgi:hypothetical protein